MTEPPRCETLADLRAEIDRIDKELHLILIERGEIMDGKTIMLSQHAALRGLAR